MTAQAKHLPADRGQGRPSLSGAGKNPVLQIVMTPEQKDKVKRLGGADWVRNAIDKAREK